MTCSFGRVVRLPCRLFSQCPHFMFLDCAYIYFSLSVNTHTHTHAYVFDTLQVHRERKKKSKSRCQHANCTSLSALHRYVIWHLTWFIFVSPPVCISLDGAHTRREKGWTTERSTLTYAIRVQWKNAQLIHPSILALVFLSLPLSLASLYNWLPSIRWYAHIEYPQRLGPFSLRSFTSNQRCLSSGDAEEVHRTH